VAKLAANVARDIDTSAKLEATGWQVLIVWEHERLEDAARRVAALIRARAPKPTPPHT
jgi:DNA mismatch endonuclease (patch repair protein)